VDAGDALGSELALTEGVGSLVVVDVDADSLDGAGALVSPDAALVGVAVDFEPRLSFL
jgi:hypothetical protein